MHAYNGNPVVYFSEHFKDDHIREVQDKISLKLHELLSFRPHAQASTQTPSFTISLSQTICSTRSTAVHNNPAFPTQRVLSPTIITVDSLIPHKNNNSYPDSDFIHRTYSRSLLLKFQHLQDDEVFHPNIQTATPSSFTDLPQPKARTGRRRVITNSEGYRFYLKKRKQKRTPKIKEFNNSYTCRTPPPSGAPGHPPGMNKECTPNSVVTSTSRRGVLRRTLRRAYRAWRSGGNKALTSIKSLLGPNKQPSPGQNCFVSVSTGRSHSREESKGAQQITRPQRL